MMNPQSNNIILPPPPYANPNYSNNLPVLQASSNQYAVQQQQPAPMIQQAPHATVIIPPQQQQNNAAQQAADSTAAPAVSEKASLLDNIAHTFSAAETSAMEISSVEKLEHKYPRAFFRVTVITVLLALITFIIWVLVSAYDYPWFIHPFHLYGMIITVTYVAGSKAILAKKLFSLHISWVVLTCIMFVFANFSVIRYPWCIYPCSVFILCFCVHALYHKFNSFFNLFSIHLIVFFIYNIVIFIAYAYGSNSFPWNLIVHCAWTAVLIIHLLLHKLLWPKISAQFSEHFAALKNVTTILTKASEAPQPAAAPKESFALENDIPAPYVLPVQPPAPVLQQQSIYPQQQPIMIAQVPTIYPQMNKV